MLKQRNALLRQGVRDDDARFTLDVFDDQLVHAGAELVRGRLRLLERLVPTVAQAYEMLALDARPISATYVSESAPVPLTATDADAVEEQLREAARAQAARRDRPRSHAGRVRTATSCILTIDGLDARHQASQGEQRTLALALRLAGHMVVRELAGAAPVLLLDDVFSELDAQRAAALVRNLPPGQTLLTTAGALPPDVEAQQTLIVHAGHVEAARPMSRS